MQKPSKGTLYGGGRRGSAGGFLRGLVAGSPEQIKQPLGAEGPTRGGGTLDTAGMDAGDAQLAERGIKVPIYKRPGLFTNLLTAGAAGQQVFDANERAQAAKNEYLSRIATQEAQEKASERLEGLRHSNALESTNAQTMSKFGHLYSDENAKAFQNAMFQPMLNQNLAQTQADTAKANLGTVENTQQMTWAAANPDKMQEKFAADAAKQGIINRATLGESGRAADVHPFNIRRMEFNESQRPTEALAATLANKTAQQNLDMHEAQRPYWGVKNMDGVFFGLDKPGMSYNILNPAYSGEEQYTPEGHTMPLTRKVHQGPSMSPYVVPGITQAEAAKDLQQFNLLSTDPATRNKVKLKQPLGTR